MIFKQIQIRKKQTEFNMKEMSGQSLLLFRDPPSTQMTPQQDSKKSVHQKVKNMLKFNSEQINTDFLKRKLSTHHSKLKKRKFTTQTSSVISQSKENNEGANESIGSSGSKNREKVQQLKSSGIFKKEINKIFDNRESIKKHLQELTLSTNNKISSKLLLIQSMNIKTTTNFAKSKNPQTVNFEVNDYQQPPQTKVRSKHLIIRNQSVIVNNYIGGPKTQNRDTHNNLFIVENLDTKEKIIKPILTSIDPVTENCHKSISHRLKFNRKLERSHLPLVIVNFDGVIGMYAKEEIGSDSQALLVRQCFAKFLSQTFLKFQIAVLIDYALYDKARAAYDYLKKFNTVDVFIDGIYKVKSQQEKSYEQILEDFESNPYDCYVVESCQALEAATTSSLCLLSQDPLKLVVPHIQVYEDFKTYNLTMKRIADMIEGAFDSNSRLVTEPKLKEIEVKQKDQQRQLKESTARTMASCLVESCSPSADFMVAYHKLLTSNYQIQQSIKKYSEDHQSSTFQSPDIMPSQDGCSSQRKSYSIRYIHFRSDATQGCQLEKVKTLALDQEPSEIIKDIIRRKLKQQ